MFVAWYVGIMQLQIVQICMLVFILAIAGMAAVAAEDWVASRYSKENGQPPVRGTRRWADWRTEYWVSVFASRHTWLYMLSALVAGVLLPCAAMLQLGARSSAVAGVSIFSGLMCLMLFSFWLLFTMGPAGLNVLIDELMQTRRPKP